MPLPETTLSLGPHIMPGESEHSQPKVAMLVRMSTETLDALQALGDKPVLDFDFNKDKLGIHIGNAFYPMGSLKEETPHELYLRTHSTSKPNAPLKLYANVTGKFTIGHERVGDNLKGKIRERTMEGVKQRDSHKTKFIETPPNIATKSKKRGQNQTPMFRNTVRPSDQAKLNASVSSTAARTASPAPPAPKKNSDPTLRARMIRCIAPQARQRDQIVRLVAGADCDEVARRNALEVLAEIGEPTSPPKKGEDPGTKTWALKTELWTEVRPYEWPGLSENERLQLSRTGRRILSSNGIQESDPLWKHFAFRSSSSSTPSSGVPPQAPSGAPSGTGQQVSKSESAKRGVSSKDIREKKSRSRVDPNTEIKVKDESARSTSRTNNTGATTREVDDALPQTTSTRKFPGSGSNQKKPSVQPTNASSGPSHTRTSQVKPAESESNTPRPSLPPKRSPVSQPPATPVKIENGIIPNQRIRKVGETDAAGAPDSERERHTQRSKDTARAKIPGKQQNNGDKRRSEETAGFLKRKSLQAEGNESDASLIGHAPQKKRKTDHTAAVSPAFKDAKPRDSSLLKKPDSAQQSREREKPRKDTSPQPPLPKINKKENPPSRPPQPSRDGKTSPPESVSLSQSRSRTENKTNGLSARRRRGSPIFTSSSEDEGEIRDPKRKVPSASLPTPPMTTPTPQFNDSTPYSTGLGLRSQPIDHADLRARYNLKYNQYMGLYVQVLTQKTLIENMLNSKDSVTETSVDTEVMNPEDLKKLVGERDRLCEELSAIRGLFTE